MAVLPEGQVGVFSIMVNVDQIPDDLKEKALGPIEIRLADIKDKEMGAHTEAQKKFRDAAIDGLGAGIKSLFNSGGETSLRLDSTAKSAT